MVSIIFSLLFQELSARLLEEKAVPCQEKYLEYRVAAGNPREKEFPSQSLIFSWNL